MINAEICLTSEMNFLYDACSSGSKMKVSLRTRPTVVAGGETFDSTIADEEDEEDEEDDEEEDELDFATGFAFFLAFTTAFEEVDLAPFTMTASIVFISSAPVSTVLRFQMAFLGTQKIRVHSGKKSKSKKFLQRKKTDGGKSVDMKSIL